MRVEWNTNCTQKSLIKIRTNGRLAVRQCSASIYLLISQVGPVHPVAHVQVNSLTGGVDDNTDDTFALLLFNKTLFDSLAGRILTGLPIELIPRIPRRTTTAVVCSMALSPSLRPLLLSYFVGFCKRGVHLTHINTGHINHFYSVAKLWSFAKIIAWNESKI